MSDEKPFRKDGKSTRHYPLSKIDTLWMEMDSLRYQHGPQFLADFLAKRYQKAIEGVIRHSRPHLDQNQILELASDVIYSFIENNYRLIENLDREKGRLRGLFYKIIRDRLAQEGRQKTMEDLAEVEESDISEDDTAPFATACMDLHSGLRRLKGKYPERHDALVAHYLEGQPIKEMAEGMGLSVDAVVQRLSRARRSFRDMIDLTEED